MQRSGILVQIYFDHREPAHAYSQNGACSQLSKAWDSASCKLVAIIFDFLVTSSSLFQLCRCYGLLGQVRVLTPPHLITETRPTFEKFHLHIWENFPQLEVVVLDGVRCVSVVVFMFVCPPKKTNRNYARASISIHVILKLLQRLHSPWYWQKNWSNLKKRCVGMTLNCMCQSAKVPLTQLLARTRCCFTQNEGRAPTWRESQAMQKEYVATFLCPYAFEPDR